MLHRTFPSVTARQPHIAEVFVRTAGNAAQARLDPNTVATLANRLCDILIVKIL